MPTILAFSILLSVIQFAMNRSLWLDEANLARNIISRSFFELLYPLDHVQVAPILYLQLTKAFSLLTPNLDYGLRILPLIAFWGSLFLFYRTVRILFRTARARELAIILALSLFAFNTTILYYSGEVKQYMTDVFVTCLFLFLLVKEYKNPVNRYWCLGLAGVAAVWLSNIAPLVLTGVGGYLLLKAGLADKRVLRHTVMVGVAWLGSFALYYRLFVHTHPTRDFMVNYWSGRGGFLPTDPFSPDFLYFLKRTADHLGSLAPFGSRAVAAVLLVLAIMGIVFMFKHRKLPLLFLIIAPVLAHLVLSAMKLYPIDRRLVLYLFPLLVITVVYGFLWLLEFVSGDRASRYLRPAMYLIPLALLLSLRGDFPREGQEIKKSLQFIELHEVAGQRLFLHAGSIAAFSYYSQTGFFDASVFSGVIEADWLWTNERLFSELMACGDGGEGGDGPCWVLFSHDSQEFEEYMLKQFQDAGVAPLKTFRTRGSAAYLLDL